MDITLNLVRKILRRARRGRHARRQAFVSAACSWFDEKHLDIPLDEHLAEAVRSGAGALEFAGERKAAREEAERLAKEFEAEVIDRFYVREEEDDSHVTLRMPHAA